MLLCPQCQFANLDSHKFCQECGYSLTQSACPTCGAGVPLTALHCTCGTQTGTTWWATISMTVGVGPLVSEEPLRPTPDRSDLYLDEHQRYQWLAAFPHPQPAGLEGSVLDCQPYQISPLMPLFGSVTSASGEPQLDSAALEAVMIPQSARPYLELQEAFSGVIPPLHDAWQQGNQEILLLADRSTLPLLLDRCGAEPDEWPLLQIWGWLTAMLDLWIALEPWHCRQSLLLVNNLHLAPDHSLWLQRLHPDVGQPSLIRLGEVWDKLFSHLPSVQSSALFTLFIDLQAGKIKHPATVRSHLAVIHPTLTPEVIGVPSGKALAYPLAKMNQVPPDLPPLPMMPDSQEPALSPSSPSAMPSSDPNIAPEVLPDLPSKTASPVEGMIPAEPVTVTEEEAVPIAEIDEGGAAAEPLQLEEPVSALEFDRESDGDDMPTIVLPMQLFSLEDAGRTDIGRQREHNEDNFGIETQVIKSEQPAGKTVRARGLYVLCDGMGGHAGGEVASALAVDTLKHYFQLHWQPTPLLGTHGQPTSQLPSADVIRDAIQQANRSIYDVNQQTARSGSGRMGTTLVLAILHDTELAVAHVGDSRLYRYTRKYGLEQLTTDHEVGQREIQRGVSAEIAYSRPDAYQLTQALGPRNEDFIQPDIQFLELNEDTLILLVSDGLTDNQLLETHWQTHIDPMMSSQMNLDKGLAQLIDLANQHNGHDNITAVAIRAKVRPNLDNLR
jgi:protein phosphatase